MTRRDDWISELHHKEFIKPKLQLEDFYWEKGKMVMSEQYHKKRGYCCGNACKHCPYSPKNQKMNKDLKGKGDNTNQTNL
jgi:hypothetical protein|tara:strand:+ start:92 stop:331 length:240 start_codon:yes stop_codon:yes gene_type:complete